MILPIYIPTLGRKRLITMESIHPELMSYVTLVTNKAQCDALARQYPDCTVVACPFSTEPGEPKANGITKGISPTRQWIVDQCTKRGCIMVDDDLTFWIRKDRKDLTAWQARRATQDDVIEMFQDMSFLTGEYAVVGVSARQGNNRLTEKLAIAKRIWNLWSVDVVLMRKLGIKFTAVPTMQDFWLQLSFLTEGYPTAMICDRMHNQSESNAPGGCSLFRSPETQKRSIDALTTRFPGFITIREAVTKGGWFGGNQPRLDVTFHGKKALAFGQLKRSIL